MSTTEVTTSQEEEERKAIISRVMNLDVKVDRGGTRATVVLPGLSYDDFDRTGNIAMWRIGKHFEFARFAAIHSSFIDGLKLIQERTMFIVTGTFDVSKELFRYIRAKRYLANCGMQTNLMTYGNSSLILKSTWYRLEDGKSLGTLTFKYVLVDRSTRKAAPLPEWFRAKFKKTSNPDNYKWLKPLKVPTEAFHYEKVIEYSDTDRNKHTNNSFYIRACFDAAATACYAKFYKHFQGDFFNYKTQKMWVLYSKESNAGDTVNVYTWEDPGHVDKVYFQIRSNGDALFHAVLQVHKDSLLKSKL